MRSLLRSTLPSTSGSTSDVSQTPRSPRSLGGLGAVLAMGAAAALAIAAPSCSEAPPSSPITDGGTGGDGGTVTGTPTLTEILPATGVLAGGEVVTLLGNNFATGATVMFGDKPGTNVQILSKTQLKVTVPAGTTIGPTAVVVKNPDGKLATSSTLFSYIRVRVLLGDDMNPTFLPVGMKPVAIAAGDLDGDGRPDLVTANEGSGDVTVLKANQNFTTPNPWAAAIGPTSVAIGEIDNRPGLDLVVGCNNTENKDMVVLLNAGSGNYGTPTAFTVGRTPTGIAARDLNGDNKAEILLSVRTTGQAHVLTNATLGNAPSFGTGPVYQLGTMPAALALADLTGDVYPELIGISESANTLSVFVGGVGSTFQTRPVTTVSGRPLAFAVGDLTGDGKADVIVPGFDSQQLTVLRGKGDGSFDALAPVSVGRGPRAAAVADIDGDGKPDALVLNSTGGTLDVLLGVGDGTFEPTQRVVISGTPYAMVVGDLNADGKPDVAAVSYENNRVILLNNRTQR